MLNYGLVNPSAGSSLWEYTGGLPPSSISTSTGVTGIKNPLPAEPDFTQFFEANALGFDYVGGTIFNDGNTVAAQAVLNNAGQWLVVNSANDATLNSEASQLVLPDRVVTTIIDYTTTNEMNIDHSVQHWRLVNQAGQELFKVQQNGRIYTNQIQAPIGAPHHNYDLPIHDSATGLLVGYIRIYQP